MTEPRLSWQITPRYLHEHFGFSRWDALLLFIVLKRGRKSPEFLNVLADYLAREPEEPSHPS